MGEEPRVPRSGLPLEGRDATRPRQRAPQAVQAPLEEGRTAADAPLRHPPIRHSFATLWIESGESAEVLQKDLGHSSITTTINTYSHLSPRYQRESFGRFGDALGGR